MGFVLGIHFLGRHLLRDADNPLSRKPHRLMNGKSYYLVPEAEYASMATGWLSELKSRSKPLGK